MKVLVTGGAGFVGSHTVDVLREEGHQVVVLDNLDAQVHGQVGGFPSNLLHHERDEAVRFVHGDVRDPSLMRSLLENIDGVLHLAAAVGVGQSMYQPAHYCDVNVGGTALLLDLLVNEKMGPSKLVVASSMSIYGEGAYLCSTCGPTYPQARDVADMAAGRWEVRCPRCRAFLNATPTGEDKPLAPTSIYAISKKTQEELVLCFGAAYRFPVVALRYFNIYGPRQSLSNPYTGVAAIFLTRLLNGKPPIIFEDGRQSRDFIHVRDVARANVRALTSTAADGRALNLGGGVAVSVLDIFQHLARALGFTGAPSITAQFRAGDVRHCFSDSSMARRLLGWTPEVPLDAGLVGLAEWSRRSAPAARDLVDAADAELQKKRLVQ